MTCDLEWRGAEHTHVRNQVLVDLANTLVGVEEDSEENTAAARSMKSALRARFCALLPISGAIWQQATRTGATAGRSVETLIPSPELNRVKTLRKSYAKPARARRSAAY